jgi:succinylglutamate desuccinylase
MKKEILFITATHGDEKIGVEVMKKIEKQDVLERFDWIIANNKALKQENRFLDRDLNRSAPGIKNSKVYELSRAYNLMEFCKKYSYVVDIHGATVNCGIFIIVSNPKLENLFLASAIPVERVVIWAADEWKKFGPITQFVDCGVEIECGPKNSEKIKNKLFKIVKLIIKKGITFNLNQIREKEWFLVYGKIKKDNKKKKIINNMKDFEEIKMDGENFYPLLTGQYKDVICYKMKKINFFGQFSY